MSAPGQPEDPNEASTRNPNWLRMLADADPRGINFAGALRDAADEIDRLRAERDALREELIQARREVRRWKASERLVAAGGHLTLIVELRAGLERSWAEAERLTAERDALAEAVRRVREMAQQAFQVLYPAAIGCHSGWNLDPDAVLAALAAVPSPDVEEKRQ